MKRQHINTFLLTIFLLIFINKGIHSQSISLSNAVDYALSHNPIIKEYEEKLTQKKYSDREAYGNFLPQINLVGSYNHLNDPLTINLNPIRDAIIQLQSNNQVELSNIYNILQGNAPLNDLERSGLYQQYSSQLNSLIPSFSSTFKDQDYRTATIIGIQPLFVGGKLISYKNYTSDEEKSSELELKQTRNEVIIETFQSYISIVLLDDVIKTRQEVLNGMEKHKAEAEKLYNEGLISNNNFLRAEVAVADAEVNLQNDQNKLSILVLNFNNTIGNKDIQQFTVIDSLEYIKIQIQADSLLSNALANQPILKILELKRDAASQNYKIERSNFLPTISAFGKYELIPDDLSELEPRWAVGIQASINIFNGFKDYNKLESASHLEDELKYLQEDTKSKINLLVNKNYKDVMNSSERYEKLQTNLSLARENVRVNEKRFESGLGTSLEVIDAELSLQKNLLDIKSALFEYYKSLSELYLSTGNPEEVIKIWNKKEL
jgi:outer membrane protein TolC